MSKATQEQVVASGPESAARWECWTCAANALAVHKRLLLGRPEWVSAPRQLKDYEISSCRTAGHDVRPAEGRR
jgi:hypothetical protein